jgi:hypothetical protein
MRISRQGLSVTCPPPYPFGLDAKRIEHGKELFKANCSACHKSFNDIVYKTDVLGTDPNRSRVLNADALALFLKDFVASVPETYETTDADGVKYKPHDLPAS